jgi:uncharacterized protein (UPF0147 family)
MFSSQQIFDAIKRTKPSKAIGPDGISPLMLKKIGTNGIEYLTDLFNLFLVELQIPSIWKVARVIPLLKPGKPAEDGGSYRPTSLLSPVAKLFEALLLEIITAHTKLAPHQHGFRKGHSTVTALHRIQDQICNGLNQKRPCSRSIMVALDMSKAFDTVSHKHLINNINDTTIPNNIKRWLNAYLRGRYTYVDFRDEKSKQRKMKQGVPQGGVLSPTLFNIYMSHIPTPPEDIKLISYADDCTLLITGTDITYMCNKLNNYLDVLMDWLTDRNLKLSPGKSTATLFTSWTKEVNFVLPIQVRDHIIPTVTHPKILGVTFDPLLTFNSHAAQINIKIKSRNNIFKKLAGSSWGKEKETLLTSYKAICRPILNYAAPIWSPQLSDCHWNKLQTCQNAALRAITGCLQMTDEDHLHQETKILPVKIHSDMISKQFLLSCHKDTHPNNDMINKTPPPRNIRRSINYQLKELDWLKLKPKITAEEYNERLKKIHTKTVKNTINNYKPNKVLKEKPPPIDKSELTLPRRTRTTLAQLRSNRSRILNNYLSKIDKSVTDNCPLCGQDKHNTEHIFNCSKNLTTLTAISLWTKPVEAAAFLGLNVQE